jgi:hypothetical protein
MPLQSLSMLLIAKAQYRVRRSDSPLPGVVEKLRNELNEHASAPKIEVALPSVLPLTGPEEFKQP